MEASQEIRKDYSIIFLAEEIHPDFAQFVQKVYHIFSAETDSFEIIVVSNGTSGLLGDELSDLRARDDRVKAFVLHKKSSESVCLRAGFEESVGEIIVICGSYQQVSDESYFQLIGAMDERTHLISPFRQRRVDPSFNQLQSRTFNWLVRKISRMDLHDLSCTVKVVRRQVLEETEIYGNMYRFLPLLAEKKGFKTKEVKCRHFQERGKTGLYSLSEYIERILDIFILYFIMHFTRKPLRFFSLIGVMFSLIGFIIGVYVLSDKLIYGYPIGTRPFIILGFFLIVLGFQIAGMGLLGEIITFTYGRQKPEYTIEKEI